MSIIEKYQGLYNSMVIKDRWKSPIYRTARKIVANKDKYIEVSKAAGGNIPWEFIGILHNRESGCDFTKHLHEGSPLTGRTRLVPKGHPRKGKPPFTFVQSAVDALRLKKFHEVTDWSAGNIANLSEIYNGLGYRNKGIPSPYLWSGSQHYVKGKYIRDHVFSPTVVDQQMGVMPLLKAIKEVSQDNTKPEDVVPRSRRLTFQQRFQRFLEWLGIGGLLSFSTLETVKNFVTDNAAVLLLAGGITVWMAVKWLQYRSMEEVAEGRYKPSKGRK